MDGFFALHFHSLFRLGLLLVLGVALLEQGEDLSPEGVHHGPRAAEDLLGSLREVRPQRLGLLQGLHVLGDGLGEVHAGVEENQLRHRLGLVAQGVFMADPLDALLPDFEHVLHPGLLLREEDGDRLEDGLGVAQAVHPLQRVGVLKLRVPGPQKFREHGARRLGRFLLLLLQQSLLLARHRRPPDELPEHVQRLQGGRGLRQVLRRLLGRLESLRWQWLARRQVPPLVELLLLLLLLGVAQEERRRPEVQLLPLGHLLNGGERRRHRKARRGRGGQPHHPAHYRMHRRHRRLHQRQIHHWRSEYGGGVTAAIFFFLHLICFLLLILLFDDSGASPAILDLDPLLFSQFPCRLPLRPRSVASGCVLLVVVVLLLVSIPWSG
mmetsp:Transcript_2600/g.6101  ORF Transcript_2600/g.6101 Transcript_2600/m.6101 type:complete len:381 (+) Transcript_2600:102-1244(+)